MDFQIKYNEPIESTAGIMTLPNLQISFSKLGKYQMVISVDGVESQLSDIITIIK